LNVYNKYLTFRRLGEIGIIHAFTTRACSNVEDILINEFKLDSGYIFTARQVHGDNVHVISDLRFPICDLENRSQKIENQIEADAIITIIKDLPIGVFTADCLPIILADTKRRAVGIIHAGRAGTSMEISKKTIITIKDVFGVSANDIIAAIGPGIGVCCYEVDNESINPFRENLSYWKKIAIKKSDRKWMLDLNKANKLQLMESGLKSENIITSGFCTSCRNDKFFSYRKEGKLAGRMISFVGIKK
jgi:YfiH family protein